MLRRDVGLSAAQGRSGLAVTSVVRESSADKKGIEKGDVIFAVNGQKVSTLDELNKAVEAGWGRAGLVLVVARGAYAYTLTFGLE